LGTHLSLTAFALAALPDPVWIPGFYDGADDDDDIVLAEMAMTVIPVTGPMLDNAPPPSRPAEPPVRPTVFRVVPERAFQIRAPPLP